jgi:hypothetical protein
MVNMVRNVGLGLAGVGGGGVWINVGTTRLIGEVSGSVWYWVLAPIGRHWRVGIIVVGYLFWLKIPFQIL